MWVLGLVEPDHSEGCGFEETQTPSRSCDRLRKDNICMQPH